MKQAIILMHQSDDPTDYLARAVSQLASGYAERGIRTHLFSPMGYFSKPAYECRGCLNIRRLILPAHAGDAGFAIRSLNHVQEFIQSAPIDAIECIDSPCSVLASIAWRTAGGHSTPVISIRTRPPTSPLEHLAEQLTDEIHASSPSPVGAALRANLSTIPLPIPSGPWVGPTTSSPAFVIPTQLAPEQYESISTAFDDSGAEHRGWSLAIAGPQGGWMLSPTPDDAQHTPRCNAPHVVIVPPAAEQAHLAGRHAISSGHLCLISDASPLAEHVPPALKDLFVYTNGCSASLEQQIRRVIEASHQQIHQWGAALAQARFDYPTTDALIDRRISIWDRRSNAATQPHQLLTWRNIEQTLANASPHALQEST